MTKYYKVNIA